MLKGNKDDGTERAFQEVESLQFAPASHHEPSAWGGIYSQPWRQKVRVRAPSRQERPAAKQPNLRAD